MGIPAREKVRRLRGSHTLTIQSDTSGKTRTPMSKAGNRPIRKALFFPAMLALGMVRCERHQIFFATSPNSE